jgi:hypothetical protein
MLGSIASCEKQTPTPFDFVATSADAGAAESAPKSSATPIAGAIYRFIERTPS